MILPDAPDAPDPAAWDAVVIGAGPNGLVAANVLADAGWRVLVLEAEDTPGGAVRSDRAVHPDHVHDTFSSFYPLAVSSPVLRSLHLERWGLRWRHAPSVLAHPLPDGRCAVLHRDRDVTAASLEAFAPGDGDAYLRLAALWDRLGDRVMDAILAPFPPVRAAARLAARLPGRGGGLRTLRMLALPARRFGAEHFAGEGGPLLFTGAGLHADFSPEMPGSGAFGLLMVMLGQHHGWPVPEGGAGELTAALVRRLRERGGELRCGTPVTGVVVASGRCRGVVTADGERVPARRVLADVPAPDLYGGLVGWEHLPARLRADMRRFEWDYATFKMDWALSGPIPWSAGDAVGAGTVHVADSIDHLARETADIAAHRLPDKPCLVLGQMTTSDPTRSPAGGESAWAYTHLPQHFEEPAGGWTAELRETVAERMEEAVERLAPGFRSRVTARRVLAPPDMRDLNRSLVGGSLNGGTAQAHQQLFLRPVPGSGRPTTPVAGLYLASAGAHPGGGVHGAPGANAARAALWAARFRRAGR
ncbi:NAD(P)/FAD-dependent oxidoreductase [Streptomyces sp. RFCAC02]|uniref:phytoene desaturase family protein n=1 Tax=Streptomyces sp. RFCAC02 TaxID=2499143 RepID=UPI0010217016|nr:NAD(P)/FAD-dependent oxidoreductase [Streptomyces sp. RFCAC02]